MTVAFRDRVQFANLTVASSGGTRTITFTTAPAVGDRVALWLFIASGAPTLTPSGLGGTWTEQHTFSSASGNYRLWTTTVVSTGSVTVASAGAVWRGGYVGLLYTADTETLTVDEVLQTSAGGTTITGPSASAGAGQMVVDVAMIAGTAGGYSTFGTYTPATGWTTDTPVVSSYLVNHARRFPSSTETHQVADSGTTGRNYIISQAVIGTAAGSTIPHGTGTGAFQWAGAGSGVKHPHATGSGAYTYTGAGAGHATHQGTGSGAFAWAGSGTGYAPPVGVQHGTGAGAFAWTGAGVGNKPVNGTGTGAFGWVGVGTGTSPATDGVATGSGTFGWSGVGIGVGSKSLDPWTDGAHGDALLAFDVPAGVLEVTYPAEPAPPAIVETLLAWQSHESATVGGDTSGMESVPLGVPHVWVDGVDVTYFRDVPTRIGSPRQEAPFGWTSTTLTFPSIFHYEENGVGDLAWLRPDAPVEIAIVKPDGSRIHRFTGQLTSDDPGTGRGRTESVWGVEGLLWQAEHAHHPVPARLDPTDSGILVTKELNGTPSRRFAPIPRALTGDPIRNRGSRSQSRWQYTTEVLSTAVREDGKQWTIEPTGPRSFRLALKDTTTVHWTVTAGAPGVELDLSKDHHERIDAVYASGVGPDGYAWSNVFFPQLLPYDPPNYPYANPDRNVLLGDRDSDTLTGAAISDWQRRIRDLGYTKVAVDGVMGSADIAAVYWIQRKRGIQVDGYMGPQTWAATWNVGTIGGDLSTVRLPMAVRPEVEPYLYGANGAVVGKNPDFDPSIIRHEIDVDFGSGVTKEQGREMAQRILERGADPGIAGTIRLSTCPWEGSRWEVNAGDNVLLKGYRGADVLMRVAAVDPDFDSLTVTLTVDSEFRDAMAVMQVLERNRESKADPARRPGNPNRRSKLDQDQATPFEGESPAGRIPRMALFGGLWTVWPVPVSEVGIVSKLRFQTSGPATKFAMAAFGKPVTANQIAAKVPNPLAKSNPWADAGDAWLDSVAWIEGWGEQGQAAGYGLLGSESDGSPVTGELIDEAGFPYVSQVAPWVWVAMWAPVACYIEGRIYPDPVQ